MSRRDRDRLRCGIDGILGEFKPSVRYDKYKIDFFPVVREVKDNSLCGKSAELIPDVYIIEISFAKSFGTVYTTNRNKCIFRCGDSNCEYSIQDLRKLVIRQQETFYNDQIKILKRELSSIRQLNDR
ncbi:uncharacterized protein LOC124459591 [Xenia sp. Carnegie-2017]|uniref:uncharacterized protein LOC124459591 n=1 Tax=Xenia sp. Carnegie-2017 TaxID=2897299 RepID=UPI001F039F27|nr:uncharacterized protein LOC124459591 [Xenia sp. Carnegie-2017]